MRIAWWMLFLPIGKRLASELFEKQENLEIDDDTGKFWLCDGI